MFDLALLKQYGGRLAERNHAFFGRGSNRVDELGHIPVANGVPDRIVGNKQFKDRRPLAVSRRHQSLIDDTEGEWDPELAALLAKVPSSDRGLSWEELDGVGKASLFTIRDAALLLERAAGKGLRGWGQAKQKLPEV